MIITDLYASLRTIEVNREIAEKDRMFNEEKFYFDAGRGALRLMLTALVARLGYKGGALPLQHIHDFGCGRVTRWLKAEFPGATLWASDTNPYAQKWCAEHLGSTIPPDPFAKDKFDLIFLGSVFTHLRPAVSEMLLEKLVSSLCIMGVLVFTSQGRYSYESIRSNPEKSNYRTKHLTAERLTALADEFERTGYAYQDYTSDRDYGISLIAQDWFVARLGKNPAVTQLLMQEKAWGSHQDGYAYLKLPIAERRLGHT
jgi:hypothetical protein